MMDVKPVKRKQSSSLHYGPRRRSTPATDTPNTLAYLFMYLYVSLGRTYAYIVILQLIQNFLMFFFYFKSSMKNWHTYIVRFDLTTIWKALIVSNRSFVLCSIQIFYKFSMTLDLNLLNRHRQLFFLQYRSIKIEIVHWIQRTNSHYLNTWSKLYI